MVGNREQKPKVGKRISKNSKLDNRSRPRRIVPQRTKIIYKSNNDAMASNLREVMADDRCAGLFAPVFKKEGKT